METTREHLGLRAAAAGWKAGHAAVETGLLAPLAVDEAELEALIQPMVARAGAAYMEQMLAAHGVTPAGGIRLWTIYIHTDVGGALNQAPDGGALLR